MENIEIIYIVIGVLILLNISVIIVAVRCAHPLPDDFEFYNEDGDHIYYDRKLIRYKNSIKESTEVNEKDFIAFNDNEYTPQSVMPNGFAILSYPCWNDELPDCNSTLYEIFFGSNAKSNKEITKEQAEDFIAKHNLRLVIDSRDGKVWE